MAALLFSGVLVALSVDIYRVLHRIRRSGTESLAVVDRYERDADGDPVPFLVFITGKGERIEGNPLIFMTASWSFGRSSKPEPGSELPVRYAPEEPGRFVMAAEESLAWKVLWVLVGLSVLTAVLGLAGLLGYIEING